MQSTDSHNFFETDASQAQRERRAAKASNKNGNPVKMKSKILAAIPDPASPVPSVFIAESAGHVRRIRLNSPEPVATYRGPRAPVTCLALGGSQCQTIFAGSWDKDIWSWDVESAQPGRKYRGHSDFVKAVVCARLTGKEILISGGADRKILVWHLDTGRRIHTLHDATTTMLAVQHLAVDPLLSTPDSLVLASASSDPHIRRWNMTLDGFAQLPESFHDVPGAKRATVEEHDTSVYRLVFDTISEEANMWTASADGTAKCLVRSRNFVAGDVLMHGDYVRAVLPTEHWVVTAGRDEDVKIWDKATGELYCTLVGHYEEVTDLVLLRNSGGPMDTLCSVSIDGTIRTWPLAKNELDDVVKKMEKSQEAKAAETETAVGESMLTAEEEAELAGLMDD